MVEKLWAGEALLACCAGLPCPWVVTAATDSCPWWWWYVGQLWEGDARARQQPAAHAHTRPASIQRRDRPSCVHTVGTVVYIFLVNRLCGTLEGFCTHCLGTVHVTRARAATCLYRFTTTSHFITAGLSISLYVCVNLVFFIAKNSCLAVHAGALAAGVAVLCPFCSVGGSTLHAVYCFEGLYYVLVFLCILNLCLVGLS